jgi:hypothetical protein
MCIPLTYICRIIHLFPSFGVTVPRERTSSNILDLCLQFYVDNFVDRHAYHITT